MVIRMCEINMTLTEQWDKTRRELWPNAKHTRQASYVGFKCVAWVGNEYEIGGEPQWIAEPNGLIRMCEVK